MRLSLSNHEITTLTIIIVPVNVYVYNPAGMIGVCGYVYAHTRLCALKCCIHIHTHVTHLCVHKHTHSTHVYVYIYIHTTLIYMYIYICIHIHTHVTHLYIAVGRQRSGQKKRKTARAMTSTDTRSMRTHI
jgi:hypothetical protein